MDTATRRRQTLAKILEDRFDKRIADLARAVDRDDAYLWQLLNGQRNIGERVARHIERSLQLAAGSLDGGTMAAEEPAEYSHGRIPVVGTTQGGDEGFYLELEYPVGHGEGFVRYPSRDANAYALRLKGDSMRPRIKPGEFVIVEPNTKPQPGEEVLVRTKDGRRSASVITPSAKTSFTRSKITSPGQASAQCSFSFSHALRKRISLSLSSLSAIRPAAIPISDPHD